MPMPSRVMSLITGLTVRPEKELTLHNPKVSHHLGIKQSPGKDVVLSRMSLDKKSGSYDKSTGAPVGVLPDNDRLRRSGSALPPFPDDGMPPDALVVSFDGVLVETDLPQLHSLLLAAWSKSQHEDNRESVLLNPNAKSKQVLSELKSAGLLDLSGGRPAGGGSALEQLTEEVVRVFLDNLGSDSQFMAEEVGKQLGMNVRSVHDVELEESEVEDVQGRYLVDQTCIKLIRRAMMKGIPVAVVSSVTPTVTMLSLMRALSMRDISNGALVVGPEQVKSPKSEFDNALQLLASFLQRDLIPDHCLALTHCIKGIRAAGEAGMKVVAVPSALSGGQLRGQTLLAPHWCVMDLSLLDDIIKRRCEEPLSTHEDPFPLE